MQIILVLDSVITVNKQWWTFKLRNNSARIASIRVYKCAPKNVSMIANAYNAWRDGLTRMQAEGELVNTVPVNQLHTGPSFSNQFSSTWKTETIEIQLNPGQAYTFSVNGPSMTYRGQDFYDNATYRVIQKQDIQLIWVSNVDLIGSETAGAAGNFGYVGNAFNESGQERVVVDSQYYCSMNMPEKVGGILTPVAIGLPQLFQNTNRVRRKVADDFLTKTFGTNAHRRDEHDPDTHMV